MKNNSYNSILCAAIGVLDGTGSIDAPGGMESMSIRCLRRPLRWDIKICSKIMNRRGIG